MVKSNPIPLAFGDPRLPERFWAKIEPEPNTGCWLWAAATTGGGYGNFFVDGRHRPSHRATWESIEGRAPSSLDLDHLCRVRLCCNPAHLSLVTRRENLHAPGSLAEPKKNAAKTACPRGHPYNGANTYYTRDGSRSCRACRSAWEDARRESRRVKVREYARRRRDLLRPNRIRKPRRMID